MKVLVLCSVFLGFSSAHDYEVGKPDNLNCNCGWTNLEEDIVTYPWVALILTNANEEYICAGTILTEYNVLTSIDCVENYSSKEIIVCVGTKEKNCGAHGEKKIVAAISIRRSLSMLKSSSNLAMVRTKDKIVFSKYIGPACFPREDTLNESIVVKEIIFLGWGESEQLKKMDCLVYRILRCKSWYKSTREGMHICAGCYGQQNVPGDGGGTFVKLDKQTGRYTVIGVLSAIPERLFTQAEPSVATNFTLYRDWAERKIYWTGKGAELCYKLYLKKN